MGYKWDDCIDAKNSASVQRMNTRIQEARAAYLARGWKSQYVPDDWSFARLEKDGRYCSIIMVPNKDQAIAVTWTNRHAWLTEEFFPPN